MSPNTQVSEDAVVIGPDDLSDFNEENILPQPAHVQESIRSWLKPTSYDAENGEFRKHLASYLPGTGEWLLESPTFREWHASKTQGMLWIKGIPGSGKSVIASSLVNHLSKEGAPVLYFFFRQIIDANHTPDALVRDWLAQLLSYSPPLQLQLKESVDKRQSLSEMSMATMWQHIKSAMIYIPKVYCVVDALDEMDSNQETFLQALAELGKWRPSRVKIIITSRPVPKVERPLRQESILHIRLVEKQVDEDIASYVAHHLDKTQKALTTEQKEVIKRAVPGRANGLFLYAKLAMDAFLEEGADVEDVLKTLPTDLNVMYTGLLREHARRSGVPHDLQLLILSFVTHASRPLRLLEIAEMIRVAEEKQAKAIGSLDALKDLVRAACGPLLEILPNETVCVIHHSFTEFLNGSTRSTESPQNSSPDGKTYPILEMNSTHNRLSLACLSYLLSGCLGQVKLPDNDDYETDSEWGDRYYVMPTVNKDLRLAYPFLAYSMDNWHVHARKADGSGPLSNELYDTISTLLSEENFEPLSVLVENGGSGRAPLHTVALLGLSQYLSRFILTHNVDVDMLDSRRETAIFHAAKVGHTNVVKVLLSLGAKPNEPSDYDGKRPLHKAAEKDHGEVVKLLLEAGVDPLTTKTKCDPGLMCGDPNKYIGHTPLMYAMSSGNASAARAFLPYLKTPETVSRALGWAVGSRNQHSKGCRAVLDELLQHPLVDINRPVRGETPLYIASRTPNTKTVIALLKAGADPTILSASQGEEFCRERDRKRQAEKSKDEKRTALHGICGGGRRYIMSSRDKDEEPKSLQECVLLMLKAGAEINAKDKYGCTPLHYAVRWWPTLVRTLVEAGADVNSIRNDGSSPLHDCQTLEGFRILVEDGNANINYQRESDGKTALLTMTDKYNKPPSFDADIIRLHVDLRADLTLTTHDGRGALHDWVSRPRDLSTEDENEALDMLLSSGVPINGADKDGKTVLHSVNGLGSDIGLTAKLVAAGGNLNARDKQGRTPIFDFVEKAHRYVKMDEFVPALDKLLEMGARLDILDYRGFNLLFVLMNPGHFGRETTKIINELVRRGLDPKATDYQGNTLFHELVAQTTGEFDSQYLDTPLKLGVNADQQNYAGQSALHFMMTPRSRPCSKGMKYFENLDVKDNDGIRPLHVAIRSSEDLVHALISQGASPTEPSADGVSPLHVAARFRDPGIVGMLMEAVESKLGKQGLVDHLNMFHVQHTPTALHLACRSGVPETVALLLAAGADPNAKSSKVGSPLEWCTQYELEKTHWNPIDDEGVSSNNSVSSKGLSEECTRAIKIHGTVRNKIKTDQGWPTELEKILSLLHDHGADFGSKAEEGLTNLDVAISKCENTYDYTIECLVRLRQALEEENGVQNVDKTHCETAHRDAEAPDLRKYAHSLIHNQQGLPLSLVHKISASVFRRHATQEAFRQVAPWHGMPKFELKRDAVEAFFKSLMEQHDWESIKHVLRQKPLLLDTEDGGKTLSMLIKYGLGSIVRAVVTPKEVLQIQSDRNDALRQSQEKGEKLLTERLQRFQPLYTACDRSTSNMAMIRCLVEELGVDVNDGHYSWSGYRKGVVGRYERITDAIHECCRGDYWWKASEALPYLIEHGADLERRDGFGRTALLWALGCGSNYKLRVVKTLVEAGADVNAVDNDGRSCLSLAGNNIEITLLLLKHGATGSVEALASSIASCNFNVLQALLDAGADPNYFHEPPDGLPASMTGWVSADKSQLPPVFLAAIRQALIYGEKGDLLTQGSMIKALLDHGADPFATFIKRNEPQDDDFMTKVVVLHQILREGGMSRCFLEMPNLDLERRNPEGMTLLLAACSSRHDPDIPIDDVYFNSENRNVTHPKSKRDQNPGGSTIIEWLLERGASIIARDHRQRNVLHLILSVSYHAGHESLRLLLSKAPELLHQTDVDGLTPLQYALRRVPPGAQFGEFCLDTKAIEILLKAGADPHQLDPNGDSALHHVGKFLALNNPRHEETHRVGDLFKKLVSLGLPINGRNKKGETPVFSVFIYPSQYGSSYGEALPPVGELKAQEILVQLGADLFAVNNAKENLLHIVAGTDTRVRRDSYLLSSVVACRFRWLLDQGLDPMAEDEKSQTCLDIAAAKENDTILAMFKRPEE